MNDMTNFIEKYLNWDDSDDHDLLTFLREQQSLLNRSPPEVNRRHRPRVDLDGEIVLQVNGLRVQRRLLNLSQGGAKITGDTPVAVGKRLPVGLHHNDQWGAAIAKVVRSDDATFSVQFLTQSPEFKAVLRKLTGSRFIG